MNLTLALTRVFGAKRECAQNMNTLRNRLYIAAGIPGTTGVVAFYLGCIASDSHSHFWFRIGVTLAITATVLGRVTWLGYRNNRLEESNIQLTRRLSQLERELADMRDDVDSHLIVKAWRQAQPNRRHRHLTPLEDRDGMG
jgi:hypothetical protein